MFDLIWSAILTSFILFILTLILCYIYGTSNYDFWKKLGVPYVKPKYPFLGTSYETAFSIKPTHVKQLEYYNYFKDKTFGGTYAFTNPVLFIKDPDLIESILIKNFTSFYNRGTAADPEFDPLTANLVNLNDSEWKNLRQKLSPAFSSGKLKGMIPQLINSSEKLVQFIEKYSVNSEAFEIRPIMSKFSTDVVACCAFGLETNTLNNPDSHFLKLGARVFEVSMINRLAFTFRSQYPQFLKYLGLKMLPQKYEDFFITLVRETIAYRENNNIIRSDFLQLLMELKKDEIEKLNKGEYGDDKPMIMTDIQMTANAFAFFVAGFDTASSALSYALFELSRNPEIQEAAYQQIIEILDKHNGEISYHMLKEITLLSQILAETLRLYPPGVEVRRKVTKNCIIPGTNITLPIGLRVGIPTYSLQHDPQYYPDPEKFLPERFTKENRVNIRKGTYLPFGDGPRMCIGKRFAKVEMRVALVKLLTQYKFTLSDKTKTPLTYESASFMLIPKGGLWLKIQRR